MICIKIYRLLYLKVYSTTMQHKTTISNWIRFIVLGSFCWGTSYYWIKIALIEIGPLTLVALRITLASTVCWLWLLISKTPMSIPKNIVGRMTIIGTTNTAIPFSLISWGETRIDSGLTGLLTATVPLFTILLSHRFLKDDKITLPKAFGLLLGFSGVVLLLSRDLDIGKMQFNLWGQVAVIGATFCYSISSVYNRRFLQNQTPMVVSTYALSSATIIIWIITFFVETPITFPNIPMTWFAIIWLGLIGTTLAYPLMFGLIHSWGPTRATLVTYLIPITAVTLGVLALDEILDWIIVVGGVLVISGVATVNWRAWLPTLWQIFASKKDYPFVTK